MVPCILNLVAWVHLQCCFYHPFGFGPQKHHFGLSETMISLSDHHEFHLYPHYASYIPRVHHSLAPRCFGPIWRPSSASATAEPSLIVCSASQDIGYGKHGVAMGPLPCENSWMRRLGMVGMRMRIMDNLTNVRICTGIRLVQMDFMYPLIGRVQGNPSKL